MKCPICGSNMISVFWVGSEMRTRCDEADCDWSATHHDRRESDIDIDFPDRRRRDVKDIFNNED